MNSMPEPRAPRSEAIAPHWRADPLADDTIARILGLWPQDALPGAQALQWQRIAAVNKAFATWTDNAAMADWQAPDSVPQDIAEALQDFIRAARDLPPWADPALIGRAERAFMDHGVLSCTLLFCASLPECYIIPDLASVLHATGQLEYNTEHRIRSTAAMIFPVMMHGGLTRPQGSGVAQVLKVRLIHATIRYLILREEPQPGRAHVRNVAPLERPAQPTIYQVLAALGWNTERDGLPCNQSELAYTLLTFGYVFLRGMRRLGIGLSEADEQAYLHTWNVVGHVLGIEGALMIHTMDQGKDLLQRMQTEGQAHLTPPDVRPALAGALMSAMEQVIPWRIARPFPRLMTRYLCDRVNFAQLGLDDQQPPLLSWLVFWFLMGTARLVDAAARCFLPRFSITRMLMRVMGYHLLVKLLMSQTRPLQLPEGLLAQMKRTVASWSDDPKAPRWLNRLEDRLTITGTWSPVPSPSATTASCGPRPAH